MRTTFVCLVFAAGLLCWNNRVVAGNAPVPSTLTMEQCLDLALKQNTAILKSKQDIQRTYGIIAETRAPALPSVKARADYSYVDRSQIEATPTGGTPLTFDNQRQPWLAVVEASQLIYSGGRVNAALRAAKLVNQAALLSFQRTVADVVLEVRQSFYLILLSQALVGVREQSVKLLERQLADTRHRFDAGTVPHFNVLRAEVELANAKPPLIRAQNSLRLARQALAKVLAIDSPIPRQDFTPITFAGQLTFEPQTWEMATAITKALEQRPELKQAEKQVAIAKESLNVSAAGQMPEVSVFGNYVIRDATFSDQVDDTVHGWAVGARATWPLFDGLLTRGRVQQSRAQLEQANLDLADTRRSIELEVRRAYSDYRQALELLEAQKKTGEQADESLRLAETRFRAGSGTQLDVLSAQTALTEARSNEIQALYDYNLAVATLERVTGSTVKIAP